MTTTMTSPRSLRTKMGDCIDEENATAPTTFIYTTGKGSQSCSSQEQLIVIDIYLFQAVK